MQKKIYILVPAFNEEASIGKVIKNLKDHGYQNILVVNDGSCDNTSSIARQAGAEVLEHIINRGQGGALQTGLEYLHKTYDPDAIVTFDADGQHKIEDLPAMLAPVLNEGYDISLGSRFLSDNIHVPLIRRLILKAGIIFTNIVSHIKLTDTHNGFRVLGKKAAASIKISHRGMEHASDIIDEITKKKLRFKEVPVEILYSDYSKAKGQASSGFVKMGIKILIKKLTS
jgi:glycosyltransferase involved in cell wall biosynthesis